MLKDNTGQQIFFFGFCSHAYIMILLENIQKLTSCDSKNPIQHLIDNHETLDKKEKGQIRRLSANGMRL